MIFGNKLNSAWMLCFFVQPMRLKVFSYKESMMVQYSIFLHGDYCHSNYGMMKKIKSCSVCSTLLKMAIFTNTCLGARKLL